MKFLRNAALFATLCLNLTDAVKEQTRELRKSGKKAGGKQGKSSGGSCDDLADDILDGTCTPLSLGVAAAFGGGFGSSLGVLPTLLSLGCELSGGSVVTPYVSPGGADAAQAAKSVIYSFLLGQAYCCPYPEVTESTAAACATTSAGFATMDGASNTQTTLSVTCCPTASATDALAYLNALGPFFSPLPPVANRNRKLETDVGVDSESDRILKLQMLGNVLGNKN